MIILRKFHITLSSNVIQYKLIFIDIINQTPNPITCIIFTKSIWAISRSTALSNSHTNIHTICLSTRCIFNNSHCYQLTALSFIQFPSCLTLIHSRLSLHHCCSRRNIWHSVSNDYTSRAPFVSLLIICKKCVKQGVCKILCRYETQP